MRTLAGNVRARLGLPASPASWSYDQRVAYLRALSADVLRYPQSFTADQLATAREIAAGSYPGLSSAAFDFGALGAEIATNAAPAIGQAKWLVWGAVALGLVLLFFRYGPQPRKG